MQAFPQHLLDEEMLKLGNMMQNCSLMTVTYSDVSTDFLVLRSCADEILPQVYLYIRQGHWVTLRLT